MATKKQQTTNYKQLFFGALVISIALLGRWGYLKASDIIVQHDTAKNQEEILKKEKVLASFSDNPGFDKLQYVQDLEKNNHMMPWSDHVNAIMAIFDELLEVDKSDTFNIEFSDFEISLESIRLH